MSIYFVRISRQFFIKNDGFLDKKSNKCYNTKYIFRQ